LSRPRLPLDGIRLVSWDVDGTLYRPLALRAAMTLRLGRACLTGRGPALLRGVRAFQRARAQLDARRGPHQSDTDPAAGSWPKRVRQVRYSVREQLSGYIGGYTEVCESIRQRFHRESVIARDVKPGTTAYVMVRWLINIFDRIPVMAALQATSQYRGNVVNLGNLPPEPYTIENIEKWARMQPDYVPDRGE